MFNTCRSLASGMTDFAFRTFCGILALVRTRGSGIDNRLYGEVTIASPRKSHRIVAVSQTSGGGTPRVRTRNNKIAGAALAEFNAERGSYHRRNNGNSNIRR